MSEDEEQAENLKNQLETVKRLALVAGLKLAAEWIRENAEHTSVFVENGEGYPVKMLSWVAQERGLDPIRCAVCNHIATDVDNLYPNFTEWNRCAAHAGVKYER